MYSFLAADVILYGKQILQNLTKHELNMLIPNMQGRRMKENKPLDAARLVKTAKAFEHGEAYRTFDKN
jgi:hypothetical protein